MLEYIERQQTLTGHQLRIVVAAVLGDMLEFFDYFLIGSLLGAFLAPYVGWRGLFAVGLMPAALTLLIRSWVPESPRWLLRMGRPEEARRALAWALEVDPKEIPLPAADEVAPVRHAWS